MKLRRITPGLGVIVIALAALPSVLSASIPTGGDDAAVIRRTQHALSLLEPLVIDLSGEDALKRAFTAYYHYRAENPEEIKNPYLFFVDFGLNSKSPRGYIFDMDRLEIVEGPFAVSHGSGSGRHGIPTRFSNRSGSHATSLGLYVTQETYDFRGTSNGRPHKSVGLRLKGVSGRFNNAARARGIVAHGAPYVTRNHAGLSWGCPAIDDSRARHILPMIANGGMVFHYSPRDREWLARDPWANGPLIPLGSPLANSDER